MDRTLSFFKWPFALFMLWSTPASAWLLWDFFAGLTYSFDSFPPMLIGFAGYLLLWLLIFRRQELGSYVSTLEHEVTHAIFALLTGHKVTRLRVTAFEGGEVVYSGKGNWLIIIAPYFFPTVTVLLLFVRPFVPQNVWFEGAVGASVAFHLGSSWHETHRGQSDLKKAGWFFTICFLPAANLLTYSFIGFFLLSGWEGIVNAARLLWEHLLVYTIPAYEYIARQISSSL